MMVLESRCKCEENWMKMELDQYEGRIYVKVKLIIFVIIQVDQWVQKLSVLEESWVKRGIDCLLWFFFLCISKGIGD